MKKNEFNGKYRCSRMCPPNYEVLFYFSVPLKNVILNDVNYATEFFD